MDASTVQPQFAARARKHVVLAALLVGFLIAAIAIAGRHLPKLRAAAPGFEQVGKASWYGPYFHGRNTANGEIFDQSELTAAHRTLPFGSRVRVTDLDTGRSVQVTINDRGPYVDGRVIDLSRAAAKQLGIVRDGVSTVRIEAEPAAASSKVASR